MNPVEQRDSQPEFFSLQVRQARRFYLDMAPAADCPLAVVCGGVERCAPDYRIERSVFPYFSIEFVARGKGQLTLAGKDFSLAPGSVFSYGPDVSQHITTDPTDPLVKYFVDFTGTRTLSLLGEHSLAPGSVGRLFAPGEVQSVFDDLVRDGLKSTGLTTALCTALLEYLVLKIAVSLMPGQAAPAPALATYHRCRQHIQEHFARLKTLGQVAQECHVDASYLCRLFRRYDRQSPYQWLMRLKMNLAAERLENPATLIKQVAAELGFDDPFHFSRAFKNVFGLSPEAFRRLR